MQERIFSLYLQLQIVVIYFEAAYRNIAIDSQLIASYNAVIQAFILMYIRVYVTRFNMCIIYWQ